ncbi:hypothetical protein J7L48_11550 [bacterium]|nr:hypothetical protein [bacterium]
MDYLKSLLEKASISGYEEDLKTFIVEKFKSSGLQLHISPMGNILAVKQGTSPYTILFDAHYDQIGFVVQKISPNGIVHLKSVGGHDPRVILGTKLIILGKEEVTGVIATIPPHLSSPDERKKVPKIAQMFLDTGLNYEQLTELVNIGDPVIFDRKIEIIDDYIIGPGIDNRGGVYTLLKLAKWLKVYDNTATIALRVTIQEEVGIRGAQMLPALPFDLAVVVDATFAKQPLANDNYTFDIDKGPTIMYGPNYSREYSRRVEEKAKLKKVKFQREVEESVRGTNAYGYRTMSGGKALIGISYPIYNMHTPSEIVKYETLKETIELFKIIVMEFNQGSVQ